MVREHRDFLILAALFASFRWFLLLSYRPGGYILDFSDYYFYRSLAQLTHRDLYPFLNLWSGYPPLFPYLMIGLYRLSALIPTWAGTGVWFYSLLGTVLLLFETGNLVLIYLMGMSLSNRANALRSCWFYAGLFVPVYTLTGWFEAMPLFFFLLALYALIRSRYHWSAVATGIGFMSKLIPVILIPLALRAIWERREGHWREMATYLLLLALVIFIIALPFLLMNPHLFLTPFQTQAHREPWESIWALWDGQYSYGIVHADVRDLDSLGGPIAPTRIPWTLVTIVFAAAFLFLYTRPISWDKPRVQVALAGLCVLGLFLYSKGYSPQFAVWVLPFIALLLPNLRGAAYAILLAALNLVEANVYFIIFPTQHQLLVATVVLRTLIFLLLAGELALILFPRLAARLGSLRRWAAVGTVVVALATALALAPGLTRAYFQDSLARNPCREAVASLQRQVGPESIVIFADQETFDLLYPHLWQRTTCRVLDDYSGGQTLASGVEAQVQRLAQGRAEVWLVTRETDDQQALATLAADALDRHLLLVQKTKHGDCTVRRYISPEGLQVPPGPARLGDVATLQGVRWDVRRDGPAAELQLLLVWEALGPSPVPLTAFTHLVSPEGQVVAGHDGPPAGGQQPTDRWEPGQTIADYHPIAMPAGLPPGRYQLEAGLYDPATGERLPVLNLQGEVVGSSVVLGTVEWP